MNHRLRTIAKNKTCSEITPTAAQLHNVHDTCRSIVVIVGMNALVDYGDSDSEDDVNSGDDAKNGNNLTPPPHCCRLPPPTSCGDGEPSSMVQWPIDYVGLKQTYHRHHSKVVLVTTGLDLSTLLAMDRGSQLYDATHTVTATHGAPPNGDHHSNVTETEDEPWKATPTIDQLVRAQENARLRHHPAHIGTQPQPTLR